MKNRYVAILVCCACILLIVPAATASESGPALNLNSLFNPLYRPWIRKHPDQFNWMVLALISRKAPKKRQSIRQNLVMTNNVEWETWADDDFTFQQTNKAPRWSRRNRELNLVQDPLQSLMAKAPNAASSTRPAQQAPPAAEPHESVDAIFATEHATIMDQPIPPAAGLTGEEVRRNHAAFVSIVERRLWYQGGISRWVKAHSHDKMRFYPGSIEIKAIWMGKPLTSSYPYHLNYVLDGSPYVLIGLHIMTSMPASLRAGATTASAASLSPAVPPLRRILDI
jgi:hypothetical protein